MTRQVSAELLKLRTTRSAAVAVLVAAAFAALVATMAGVDPERFGVAPLTAESLVEMLRAPGHVAAGAALIVGILAVTVEHSHHTWITTRLVEPDPRRVLVAKVAAVAAAGLVIGACAEGVAAAAGVVGLRLNDVALAPNLGEPLRAVGTVLLASSLTAVLGLALGALLRSTAAALATALLWVFALENVIPLLLGTGQAPAWLPGQALDSLLTPGGRTSQMAAALLLAACALVLTGVAMALESRRDA